MYKDIQSFNYINTTSSHNKSSENNASITSMQIYTWKACFFFNADLVPGKPRAEAATIFLVRHGQSTWNLAAKQLEAGCC